VWRKFIGEKPFAVLLGDDIGQGEKPGLRQMDEYEKNCSSIMGVHPVPMDETHRYRT